MSKPSRHTEPLTFISMMLLEVPYALTAGPSMKEGLMETRSNLYSVLKSHASFSANVCAESTALQVR